MLAFLTGCSHVEVKNERIRDLDYTVLSEDKLPQELREIIATKKEEPFKMTFQDDGFLYICQGYGRKEETGYCIQIKKAYEAPNAIYFSTILIGAPEGEQRTTEPSFPYLVIKTEKQDKVVVFDE